MQLLQTILTERAAGGGENQTVNLLSASPLKQLKEGAMLAIKRNQRRPMAGG